MLFAQARYANAPKWMWQWFITVNMSDVESVLSKKIFRVETVSLGASDLKIAPLVSDHPYFKWAELQQQIVL